MKMCCLASVVLPRLCAELRCNLTASCDAFLCVHMEDKVVCLVKFLTAQSRTPVLST